MYVEGTATNVARRGSDGRWRYVIDNPFGYVIDNPFGTRAQQLLTEETPEPMS
ncbi:hypothetical protein [Streptomyces coeruleofuscus]|uniref:Uncharacterized protein n=1 Tax=Streptomyces coeruleofuscus TaxID=66879 RepID=A0ABP5VFT7_9ACTN